MNIEKLAALKFAANYRRNDVTVSGVGAYINAVCFDGLYMWASGQSGVCKLRISDGAILQTIPTGNSPLSMATDGVNLWVANYTDRSVTVIRLSDGVVIQTITGLVAKPEGVVWDGDFFWIAMNDMSQVIQKFNPVSYAVVQTVTVGTGPNGLCFDGENVWSANIMSASVSKVRASDGAVLGTFSVANYPTNACFDGENVWISSSPGTPGVVTKMATDGTVLSTTNVPNAPRGILFDGDEIWVTGSSLGVVSRIRKSDGALLDTLNTGPGSRGIAFDGLRIWVANSSANTVTRY